MKFETKVIHAGIKPDPSTGAIMTPIFQTSSYVQKKPGDHLGFQYARSQNPTRTILQENLAALENGKFGISFSSGMAAIDAVLRLLNPGDEVIATNDLYGGTYRLMTQVFENYGIKLHFIGLSDDIELKARINDKTRLLWIETPTNPMLNIIDIKKMVQCVNDQILVCVDNTFASPYLQNPLDLGADIVMHSATKYLGGHSDVIHGCLMLNDEDLAMKLYFIQNAVGAVPGPQDCFLILRGIKTLHVRMDRACENAAYIAEKLLNYEKINKVYFPGLASHDGHKLAAEQMKLFGAMISFDLKEDTMENAEKILSSTNLFSLAESLGGVESLLGHPATMTHGSIPRDERYKIGLTDSLIRLSVGIENKEDLWEDLRQAIES